MADLDDFFAKKDRKKSKSVKKFATADELAKKMEDTKQKSDVRPKKDRPAQEGEEGSRAGKEEEWREYEETVKDYTGLKIQVLQGGGGGQGGNTSDGGTSEDAASESGKPRGPWNKPSEEPVAAPPVVEEKPKPEPAPKSATYVPPVARQRPAEPARRPASRHAPDIHNDDYFPVLGATAKRGGGWSTAGGAVTQRATHTRQPLALGNRFNSLPDDS